LRFLRIFLAAGSSLCIALPVVAAKPAPTSRWETVVNKNDAMPNSATGRTYNSFNQPSVNADGVVVFRARSRGGPPDGSPTRGIYVRDMRARNGEIMTIAGGDTAVPYPNNILYPPDDEPTSFIEFPSIPRIGIYSGAVATRGNHQPVWTYELPDGSETRVGTTGIYANLNSTDPDSDLLTGASKLGAVNPFQFYAVPGPTSTIPFDVFPGTPAITDDRIIAFKGNYTDGVAQTGVFFRKLDDMDMGGTANYVTLIANSDTAVPNPGDCASGTTFGSTAPPSAARDRGGVNRAVFVGLDNENSPTCGGIYLAPLTPVPSLTTLVGLDSHVPGEPAGTTFTQLGEGLSYDGRFVGFWGAWGDQTKVLRLYCPTEGNRNRIDFCNRVGNYDDETGEYQGDQNSICDDDSDATDSCYQEQAVPVNQGIFIHDTRTGDTYRVAAATDDFDDFVYWVYSGRVPGTGEGGGEEGDGGEDDGEPARWRSSAFVAVSGRGAAVWAAFKARTGDISPLDNTYESPVDGIYLARQPGASRLETLVDTTMAGQAIDPEAPAASVITGVGLERDSFRGQWLVINASMEEEGGEEDAGMAGIYITRQP
jgi:hypothetical protein